MLFNPYSMQETVIGGPKKISEGLQKRKGLHKTNPFLQDHPSKSTFSRQKAHFFGIAKRLQGGDVVGVQGYYYPTNA